MSNYRDQLEAYLKTLDIKADRVLDVGGAALPVKNRVKSWDVEEYKIADNGLEVGGADVRMDLNISPKIIHDGSIAPIMNELADIVFCLEVMEYIFNPSLALELLNDCLKDGGLLYITFPFIYPVHNPKENDYSRYTRQGAIKSLNEAGFKILQITPRLMTASGITQWKQFMDCEGMHAARGIEHNELGVIIKAQKI